MITRKLKRAEVQTKPYLIWNAYVDLLAREKYEDLNEAQRPAHLVFRYEGEVQNGGHLQYFENRGDALAGETVDALCKLQADDHSKLLREATTRWRCREREPIKTAEDFCEEAMEGEFADLDTRFYQLPALQKVLEQYLARNQSSFVLLE